MTRWGRLIFYVTDVDVFWNHLKDRGFDPEIPRDASWGERYFHAPDPDAHELSFARPAQGGTLGVKDQREDQGDHEDRRTVRCDATRRATLAYRRNLSGLRAIDEEVGIA